MRRTVAIFTALLLALCSLSACSKGTYEDGFAAGYDAGYQAALAHQQNDSISFRDQDSKDNSEGTTSPTEIHLTKLPEPDNGHIFEDDFEDFSLVKVAPLSIETGGTGGYYIVVDPVSFPAEGPSNSFEVYRAKLTADYAYMKFYVDANSTVDLLVPLGEYEIYYATGEEWYGEDVLFGPDTQYYKCDDTFLFTIENDQYIGWTLELKPVMNGNLDTDKIDTEEFPHQTT